MTEIATPTGEGLLDDAPAPAETVAPYSPAYRTYALWLLMLIYVVSFLDRQVINILAEPIKNELGLLDWQIGAMSGFAFAIFYTLLGLPIARLAEHGHRPYIISAALAIWSSARTVSRSVTRASCSFAPRTWNCAAPTAPRSSGQTAQASPRCSRPSLGISPRWPERLSSAPACTLATLPRRKMP